MPHTPYIRHVPGGTKAVLMIHGIAGSPIQFRDLIPVIPEDWSVYNILLEGHGGTAMDFGRSSLAKWRAQVERQLQDMLDRYDQVVILGHSMGTLFAIQGAIAHPNRVPALFLLQVPLAIHMPPATCLATTQAALGWYKPGSPAEGIRSATAMELTPWLWKYLTWIPRFLELFREIERTKKLLPQLKVPSKSFPAAKDELVSSRALKHLENHPWIENIPLPDSGHYLYGPEDTALLRQELLKTITQTEENSHR